MKPWVDRKYSEHSLQKAMTKHESMLSLGFLRAVDDVGDDDLHDDSLCVCDKYVLEMLEACISPYCMQGLLRGQRDEDCNQGPLALRFTLASIFGP